MNKKIIIMVTVVWVCVIGVVAVYLNMPEPEVVKIEIPANCETFTFIETENGTKMICNPEESSKP